MRAKDISNFAARIGKRVQRVSQFALGWITAPSVPKLASELERPNDPRRPELRNVPPAGLGGSM